jgi:hypothetical protein
MRYSNPYLLEGKKKRKWKRDSDEKMTEAIDEQIKGKAVKQRWIVETIQR